jgi:hypothetical protein
VAKGGVSGRQATEQKLKLRWITGNKASKVRPVDESDAVDQQQT